jgi:PhnB protein
MAEEAEIHEYAGPILIIRGNRAKEAIDFYVKAFGAEAPAIGHLPAPDGKRVLNAHLHILGSDVLLTDDFPEENGGRQSPPPACISMHLQVKDADATWAKAVAAGAEVVTPLADMPWGYRLGQLRDPFEHLWSIGSPKTA